jgi:hypothetical protein
MTNLLYKASIVTTPTAYGVGVLNSIKPAQSFSEELVTNGNFSNGTTDWSVLNGTISIDNNRLKLDGTSGATAEQTVTAIIGRTYLVTYEFTLGTATSGALIITGGNYPTLDAPQGVNSFYSIATSTSFRVRPRLGSAGTMFVDNVSVVEMTDADFDFTRTSSATRVNPDYLIETVATDIPRLDYTNGTASILLEPQSTNVLPYFKDFSQYSLGGNSSLTYESNIIAPDGTLGVYRLNLLAASESYLLFGTYIGQNLSVYAKSVNPNSNNQFTFYSQNVASGIKTTTANWERFDNDFGSSVNSQCYISNGVDSYATDIYIWGAQLEALSYPTSIIPTSGQSGGVTRAAESLNNAGNSDLINSTEGVLYAEISALANDGTSRSISIFQNSSNFIKFQYSPTSNRVDFVAFSSGAVSCNITKVITNTTENAKFGLKWKLNDFAFWINGVEVGTDLSGNTPIGMDKISFTNENGSGGNFYGKCKTIAVFKEALSDTELACLTSTNNREIFLNYYYRMQYVGANTEALSCAEQTFNI